MTKPVDTNGSNDMIGITNKISPTTSHFRQAASLLIQEM